MRILAIDTALDACSAAVIDTIGDRVLASESREIGRGHAELLLPIVDDVMKAAAIKFEEIDRFAVTVGPGSFTGLRVGLSAARGFALVSKKPVVGISTLAAFTAPLITQDQAVPVVAAIDAKHGNLYMQMVGAGGRTLVTARAASLRETIRAVALGPVRIVGTGAAILAAHWPAKAPAPVLVDQRAAPDILWIARIGAAADPTQAPPRPLYLKLPDAAPPVAARVAQR
jgi:tRNA threonylcarbamoyladenosine biosynthesis protein TsaB